jgi:phage terminase large subunit-like protein
VSHERVNLAHGYARDVAAGLIDVCKWVREACERDERDRGREGDSVFPYRFDAAKGERACRFIECLPHTKGQWARRGELIRLEPWQCFLVSRIFGWVSKETGLRRFRRAYLEVPRKNAKSTIAAAIGLYCFAAEGEHGAEVYSGATTEKQAWEVFRPARLMAKLDEFREAFGVEVGAKNLHIPANGSRFEPLIGKPGDGASPSLAIVDEYHEHDSDDLADTMQTGMGAREQPLMFYTTTAGDNIAGPCYALHCEAQKVLDGVFEDERLFALIYTLDEGDDWTTEASLRKTNPNYDVSVSGEFLRDQQREAINDARKQGIFKTKHGCVWVASRAAWFNMEDWNRCANPSLSWSDLAEWDSCLGMDMALKLDFACAVIVARSGDRYRLKARHYLPEDTASDPAKQHYQKWVHDGHVTATEGGEIDFDRVERELSEVVLQVRPSELALDPDRYGVSVAQGIERRTGIQRVEMPMGTYRSFSAAMLEMQAAARTGRLEHDGDPVLAWMVSNVVAREDARGNLYPRKERPENKIDGAVASIIAWTRIMGDDAQQPSVYEQHGEAEWREAAPAEVVEGEEQSPQPVRRSIYDQHTAEEWSR